VNMPMVESEETACRRGQHIWWNSHTGEENFRGNTRSTGKKPALKRLKPPQGTAWLLLLHMADELYILSASSRKGSRVI